MPSPIRIKPLVLALLPLLAAAAPAAACDEERRRCWSEAILFHTASEVDVAACDAAYAGCIGRRLIGY